MVPSYNFEKKNCGKQIEATFCSFVKTGGGRIWV